MIGIYESSYEHSEKDRTKETRLLDSGCVDASVRSGRFALQWFGSAAGAMVDYGRVTESSYVKCFASMLLTHIRKLKKPSRQWQKRCVSHCTRTFVQRQKDKIKKTWFSLILGVVTQCESRNSSGPGILPWSSQSYSRWQMPLCPGRMEEESFFSKKGKRRCGEGGGMQWWWRWPDVHRCARSDQIDLCPP